MKLSTGNEEHLIDFNSLFNQKGGFKLFGKDNLTFDCIEESLNPAVDTQKVDTRDTANNEDYILKEQLEAVENSIMMNQKKKESPVKEIKTIKTVITYI